MQSIENIFGKPSPTAHYYVLLSLYLFNSKKDKVELFFFYLR